MRNNIIGVCVRGEYRIKYVLDYNKLVKFYLSFMFLLAMATKIQICITQRAKRTGTHGRITLRKCIYVTHIISVGIYSVHVCTFTTLTFKQIFFANYFF